MANTTFDSFYFASNLTSYVCPGFEGDKCKPPGACARDSSTGKEYCCTADNDSHHVCWALTTKCATDGTTFACSNDGYNWCCLYGSEACTGDQGQINICWNSSPDPLENITVAMLNETYSSLSSASPSASSWTFDPVALIAATATTSSSSSSSTSSTITTTTSSSSSSSSSTSMTTTSTQASSTQTAPASSTSSSLSGGSIAGIVIGALAAVALILGLAWFFLRKRRNQTGTETGNKSTSPDNRYIAYQPVESSTLSHGTEHQMSDVLPAGNKPLQGSTWVELPNSIRHELPGE